MLQIYSNENLPDIRRNRKGPYFALKIFLEAIVNRWSCPSESVPGPARGSLKRASITAATVVVGPVLTRMISPPCTCTSTSTMGETQKG